MKKKITEYFASQKKVATVKYLDPSYMIRWVIVCDLSISCPEM